jgi:hypothetical protein
MATSSARRATLQLNDTAKPTFLRVSLPPRISEPELARLTDHIVKNIVFPHTGCSCLSGTISVLIESVFQAAVQVEV